MYVFPRYVPPATALSESWGLYCRKTDRQADSQTDRRYFCRGFPERWRQVVVCVCCGGGRALSVLCTLLYVRESLDRRPLHPFQKTQTFINGETVVVVCGAGTGEGWGGTHLVRVPLSVWPTTRLVWKERREGQRKGVPWRKKGRRWALL